MSIWNCSTKTFTDSQTLSLREEIFVGATSVKAISDTTKTSRVLLSCGQTLYALEYLAPPLPAAPGLLNRVWLTDPDSPAFQPESLAYFAQANSWIPQRSTKFGAGCVFYLTRSYLYLADISQLSEPSMIPRHLPLAGTPSRVIYSSHLKGLIVLYTKITVGSERSLSTQNERPRWRGLDPAITFLQPDYEYSRSGSHPNSPVNAVQIEDFRLGEQFLGIMEWFPTDGEREHYLLVVNSMIERTANRKASGRILLFSPKLDATGAFTLTRKTHIDLEGPVWSVAAFGKSSLIYAYATSIAMHTFDVTNKRLGTPIKVTLRSRATHVSVEEPFLYISTAESGLFVFKVDNERFIPYCAEGSVRPGIHHFVVARDSLVLTSDMACKLTGLWQPPQVRVDKTAPPVFEVNLTGSVTKFSQIARPAWQRRYSVLDSETIVGSCTDGTIYQFAILNKSTWRLLAFIQNMAMRCSMICPYSQTRFTERHIEPSTANKQELHINGDILVRLLQRGGAELLAQLLSLEPDPNMKYLDFENPHSRIERFQELVKEAFGLLPDDGLTDIVKWLQILLLPAL